MASATSGLARARSASPHLPSSTSNQPNSSTLIPSSSSAPPSPPPAEVQQTATPASDKWSSVTGRFFAQVLAVGMVGDGKQRSPQLLNCFPPATQLQPPKTAPMFIFPDAEILLDDSKNPDLYATTFKVPV